MTDAAYENAKKRRETLQAEQAQLSARMAEIRAELADIDRFVEAWRRFAGVAGYDNASPDPEVGPIRPVNPPKEEVGDAVEAIIRRAARPMARSAIFRALEREGVSLQGKDPQMILSTMLWRMQDRFVRLPPYGYWVSDTPFPPADYVPQARLDL